MQPYYVFIPCLDTPWTACTSLLQRTTTADPKKLHAKNKLRCFNDLTVLSMVRLSRVVKFCVGGGWSKFIEPTDLRVLPKLRSCFVAVGGWWNKKTRTPTENYPNKTHRALLSCTPTGTQIIDKMYSCSS